MLFSSGVHRRGGLSGLCGRRRTLGRDEQTRFAALQARAAAQAGAHVDINVHVTTGGAAAAASASAQPNVQRPESKQPNIAGFFSKRAAPTGSEPEMVGAAGRERPKLRPRSRRARRPWSRKGKTCATALPLAFQCVLVRHLMFNRDVIRPLVATVRAAADAATTGGVGADERSRRIISGIRRVSTNWPRRRRSC